MTHPITPPPELVQQWAKDRVLLCDRTPLHEYIATRASQWGADQELEACLVEASFLASRSLADRMRAARRPKPPSLKEQALEALERQCLRSISPLVSTSDLDTIRRALEALPDD